MVVITPGYSDFYSNELPNYSDLVSTVPSRVIFEFFCFINGIINYHEISKRRDKLIFKYVGRRLKRSTRIHIEKRIFEISVNLNSQVILFDLKFTLELIQHELLNYRDFDFIDTNEEQCKSSNKSGPLSE